MREKAFVVIAVLALLACALAWGDEQAPPDVQQFLQRIADANPKVRSTAWGEAKNYGAAAVPGLGELLDSSDRGVARAAKLALENIVGQASTPGADAERQAVALKLVSALRAAQSRFARVTCIQLLGLIGRGEAVPALAQLLDDEEVGEDVRQALQRIPGNEATGALLAALRTHRGPFARAIIYALASRGDRAAVPTLARLAAASDLPTRLAAIDTLGRIGDLRAEHVLSNALRAREREVRRAATDALLRLAEAQLRAHNRHVAAQIFQKLLGAQLSQSQRCAALAGIAQTAGAQAVPKLVAALAGQGRVVADCARSLLLSLEDEGTLQALAAAGTQAAPEVRAQVLEIIAARNDPGAAQVLLAALQAPELVVRRAAVVALGELAAGEAKEVLLELAEHGPEELRQEALEACLKIARRYCERGRGLDAASIYRRVLAIAPTADTRRTVLDGLAELAEPKTLPLIEPLINDPQVRKEALAACVAVGVTLARRGERDRAIALLNKALAPEVDPALANRAARELYALGIEVDLAQRQGFVTNWWLAGPMPNPNRSAFVREFFPEREINLAKTYEVEGRTISWKPHKTVDVRGIVDLRELFVPNSSVVAYGYAEIFVDKAQDVVLKIGSDDGIVVWVNGEKVHAKNVDRGIRVDQDIAKARFVAGKNSILVKVLQQGGYWCFCVRLTTPDGKPLKFKEHKVNSW